MAGKVDDKETAPRAMPEAAGAPAPGAALGGYVLERRLGRGGMGTVFAARQVSLGRTVALKVLAREWMDDPEFLRRFDREARVLAALNHPGIVRVIDKGVERGHVFLAMEYADGVSLRELIDGKKLAPEQALKIVAQLCAALDYAHAQGVVHRDIKPENILVEPSGAVKVADFGIAKIVGERASLRLTSPSTILGTLDYMAPEQRESTRDADHRADLYALGVVLYEMLTGELPIGRFEPPSKKVKLEVDIDEVVLKVLSKDPEMRYQRASDVAEEIRRRSERGRGSESERDASAGAWAATVGPRVAPLPAAPAADFETGQRAAAAALVGTALLLLGAGMLDPFRVLVLAAATALLGYAAATLFRALLRRARGGRSWIGTAAVGALIAFLALAGAGALAHSVADEARMRRVEARWGEVREGMTRAEVRGLLGRPTLEFGPGGFLDLDLKLDLGIFGRRDREREPGRAWAYGRSRLLPFPAPDRLFGTLASDRVVQFDREGKVLEMQWPGER